MDELCIMNWDTIANFDKDNSEIRFIFVQYWQNAIQKSYQIRNINR